MAPSERQQHSTLRTGHDSVLRRHKAHCQEAEEENDHNNGTSHITPFSSLTTSNEERVGKGRERERGDIMAMAGQLVGVAWGHPLPCFFALCVLLFMGVEYSLVMVPHSSPPLDIGFYLTRPLNRFLAIRPALNSILAALNTVFVLMQTLYILWCLVVEWRPRATIATAFMFTCRGILGYCTQLPLPQEFLGSGMDFPVGNVSFFLFFSGHVAAAVIASMDMRRVGRKGLAWAFDVLNVLQVLRLLATRGHYTIDLAVGVGAGVLFDHFASKYLEEHSKTHLVLVDAVANSRTTWRKKSQVLQNSIDYSCCCSCCEATANPCNDN